MGRDNFVGFFLNNFFLIFFILFFIFVIFIYLFIYFWLAVMGHLTSLYFLLCWFFMFHTFIFNFFFPNITDFNIFMGFLQFFVNNLIFFKFDYLQCVVFERFTKLFSLNLYLHRHHAYLLCFQMMIQNLMEYWRTFDVTEFQDWFYIHQIQYCCGWR